MDLSGFLENFIEINWNTILVIIHVVGVAIGVGGASISDVLFLHSLKNKKISAERFSILMTISKVIWIGFWILVVSGALLFLLVYLERGSIPMLSAPRWQAKLTWVAIIFVNGLLFKFSVFPRMKKLVGKTLSLENTKSSIWHMASSGFISIFTWYSVVIIILLPRSFRVPYPILMGAYAIVILTGIFIAHAILKKKIAAES